MTEYLDAYDVAAELRPGGDRHDSLRYGAAIEIGLREFLTGGGFTAFTTNFEDLAGLRQLPGLAVQRLMADGYGFGGEGDWKTSVILRTTKAMAAGRPGGTSFMEDYTYDLATPGSEKILGAHMLEVCPSIAGTRPTLEIHPLGIGGREDPVRLRFTAAPGPAVVVGINDMGDRFRLTLNEVAVVEPDAPLPNLPVACAVWVPEAGLRHLRRGVDPRRRPAPHRAVHRRRHPGVPRPGDDAVHRARRHRRLDHHPVRRERAAVERGLPPPSGPALAWRPRNTLTEPAIARPHACDLRDI